MGDLSHISSYCVFVYNCFNHDLIRGRYQRVCGKQRRLQFSRYLHQHRGRLNVYLSTCIHGRWTKLYRYEFKCPGMFGL